MFSVATKLYAEGGWPSFSFEAIAKRAKVGKAALYRRWNSPLDLLKEILEHHWSFLTTINTGSLRSDLVALVEARFERELYLDGGVAAHLVADAERSGDIAELTRTLGRDVNREFALVVDRAKRRGELPADVNAVLILDVVMGAVANHVMATPKSLRKKMEGAKDGYIGELVDFIIAGVSARPRDERP